MEHRQGRNIGNYSTMIRLRFLKVKQFLITGMFLIFGFIELQINIFLYFIYLVVRPSSRKVACSSVPNQNYWKMYFINLGAKN